MAKAKAIEHTKHIYVVREGGTIFWPNGLLRGSAGYAVRGDDPFMTRYFNSGCTPAMLILNDDAVPGPYEDWPAQYRRAAGDKYLTKLEKKQKTAQAKAERENKESKKESAKRVMAEIPLPDEK